MLHFGAKDEALRKITFVCFVLFFFVYLIVLKSWARPLHFDVDNPEEYRTLCWFMQITWGYFKCSIIEFGQILLNKDTSIIFVSFLVTE